jgi:type II secretory pathway pseudopilin PulG
MEVNMNKQSSESGFALLMTLIVVGVVLSIGMSILELSIKQVRLSTIAKESETAFNAANAGLECARYWRRKSFVEMENGAPITPFCFGPGNAPDSNAIDSVTPTLLAGSDDGEAFLYEYSFTWGVGAPRCTQIYTLVAVASSTAPMTVTNMIALVPGYTEGSSMTCDPGARCTVISVQGYNKSCDAIGGYGVVQREVLLQF